MAPLLECRGLGFSIGRVPLVKNVSFELEGGEFLGIVGANGAGKSTLLHLLAGDLAPTTGSVSVSGKPLRRCRAAELARLRAVLPQRSAVEFSFSVEEVVRMGRSPHRPHGRRLFGPIRGRTCGEDVASLRARETAFIDDCLGRAGVRHLAGRAYPTLSGGEQARTCFARILAQDAPLLLLDEPTAALDIRYQHLVLGEAQRLAGRGYAVAAVLHDLNLAAAYATRVAVMHGGAMRAIGEPDAVLTAETLSAVYDHPVDVMTDASTGRRLVVPRPIQ